MCVIGMIIAIILVMQIWNVLDEEVKEFSCRFGMIILI